MEHKAPEHRAAYSKDDFFDELSCEALERLHLAESGGCQPLPLTYGQRFLWHGAGPPAYL